MSDQKIILQLLISTILLSWFTVVGLTASLCGEMSCGGRVLCGLAGMGCGTVLFLQIACAQIARFYRTQLESQAASPRA